MRTRAAGGLAAVGVPGAVKEGERGPNDVSDM